jgi:hypothetical protein
VFCRERLGRFELGQQLDGVGPHSLIFSHSTLARSGLAVPPPCF